MSFKDKAVIITGASSGIGAETARCFAKEGACLCLTGRNEERLSKVAEECKSLGAEKVIQVIADLNETKSPEKIISATVDGFKKIDVLFNNAGILVMGGFCEASMDDYDFIFNTNVKAVVLLSRLAVPYLKTTKGCIVNNSSVVTTLTSPTSAFYSMSKWALDCFTKCAALDLAQFGVRVNAVNPGAVMTNIFGDPTTSVNAAGYKHCGEITPMKRLVTPEDVANAVVFLSSEKANGITGLLMLVDCGLGSLSVLSNLKISAIN